MNENSSYFYSLRTINSCLTKINELNKKIETEKTRLQTLLEKRTKAENKIKILLSESEDANSNYQKIDQQLKQRLSEEKKTELEQVAFDYLLKIDELQEEIKDGEGFIQGFTISLGEMKTEIDQEISLHQTEIGHQQKEISSCEEQLPSEWKEKFERTLKKNKTHPFTFYQNGKCMVCQSAISRNQDSIVQEMLELVSCAQCGRIILPTNIHS